MERVHHQRRGSHRPSRRTGTGLARSTLCTSRPVPAGIIGSFSDAPGGAKEELREINIGSGMEYWYDNLIAFRMGGFHEDKTKGNRSYLTFGLGVKYSVFAIDLSYLVPITQRNPLQNTLRFSLSFEFAKAKKTDNASDDKAPKGN